MYFFMYLIFISVTKQDFQQQLYLKSMFFFYRKLIMTHKTIHKTF